MPLGMTAEHEIAYRHKCGRTRSGDAARLVAVLRAECRRRGLETPLWAENIVAPASAKRPMPRSYNGRAERILVGDLLDALADLPDECPF